MQKPKHSQKEDSENRQERDFFQTPNYAIDLIIPYIPVGIIWEPAAGNGKIARRLSQQVVQSDIENSDTIHYRANFLTWDNPTFHFDSIVTNPPFSLKRKFWERCLFFNVPFALLLPVDFCGWILREMMMEENQWLIPTRRIDYITPTGRQGESSHAQYHSGWFCHGMDLPKQITVVELTNEMKENI